MPAVADIECAFLIALAPTTVTVYVAARRGGIDEERLAQQDAVSGPQIRTVVLGLQPLSRVVRKRQIIASEKCAHLHGLARIKLKVRLPEEVPERRLLEMKGAPEQVGASAPAGSEPSDVPVAMDVA